MAGYGSYQARRAGRMARAFVLGAACAVALTIPAASALIYNPDAPRVYFISPHDKATLTSPFIVRFGLKGFGVAPAGVPKSRTGHHHLLIDADPPPLEETIPEDANHLHFGGGQTEAIISLAPGIYKLRLVLGDANHYPLAAMVSEVISITVVADDATP